MLQHTATCCNALQHSQSKLPRALSRREHKERAQQHTATRHLRECVASGSMLQHTTTYCTALQHSQLNLPHGLSTCEYSEGHCNALQHGIHVNASRRAHARVIPHARASQESQTHIWMHHCTHMDETWCTRDGVMALMWMRHFADMKESYLTCELLHTVTHTQ